ncbi:hypothetical protein LCGC14_1731740 [marine sediment metagenome]|uniref:Uncharacterized protein n=1 Tax=marine sediment metagenome TaxID=412755 RepID=A0A0F9H950_9ZZZZ
MTNPKTVLELCKELGKKVDEFDCVYRKRKNCRIINGKPYCTALENARNFTLKKEAENILKKITKEAKKK